MGVILEYNDYTPICDLCGIVLCHALDEYDYMEYKDYWDNWKCKECDPLYFEKWCAERRKEKMITVKKNND